VRKFEGIMKVPEKDWLAGIVAFALYTGVASAGRSKDKVNVYNG
jgi:hypothetical protein